MFIIIKEESSLIVVCLRIEGIVHIFLLLKPFDLASSNLESQYCVCLLLYRAEKNK